MADMFLHEARYRGRDRVNGLAERALVVCGAGALGSLLTDNLVRQGCRRISVVDFDRVEVHNTGTQLYGKGDVGAFKVDVLRALCFRNTGVEIGAFSKRIEERTVGRLLAGAELVLDTLDNSASRRLVSNHCRSTGTKCLHLGMNADFGQVHWDEGYRVPADAAEGDLCDYPLARNLVLLVVAAGSEAVLGWLLDGECRNYSITLRDLAINLERD
ncbi:MAG TPA: ThiF family adenylyltransferase [Spirochaetia bacterium]|nr:ThiF family adenylyltransferase [Spirochaetia bacterium]